MNVGDSVDVDRRWRSLYRGAGIATLVSVAAILLGLGTFSSRPYAVALSGG
jgi:hypothetical protein